MSIAILFTLFLCVSFSVSQSTWSVCNNPAQASIYQDFTAFPNPVEVGSQLYVRTIINLSNEVQNGTISFVVYFGKQTQDNMVVNVKDVDLCTFSESVQCPLTSGSHILTWRFDVPKISPGNYTAKYVINSPSLTSDSGCISFTVRVSDASFNSNNFTSWYQAVLSGTANFDKPVISTRTVGDAIQVGPFGRLASVPTLQYGLISHVVGSGDLVPSPFSPSGYIWGLFGNMTQQSKTQSNVSTPIQIDTYEGICYLGYVGGDLNYNNAYNSVITGQFYLTWTTSPKYQQAKVSGYVVFGANISYLPAGWPAPVLLPRISNHTVVTDTEGFFKIMGSTLYCLSNTGCELGLAPVQQSSDSFSDVDLGLTVGLIAGFALIVVLIVATLLYLRNKRDSEQEDGIFAVSRKPEYGSALVVDDIIQETRGKDRDLRPMLNPNRNPPPDSLDSEDFGDYDDSSEGESDGRSPSRGGYNRRDDTDSESRSRSRPRRSLSRSSNGDSGSRSRSPRRSNRSASPGSTATPRYSDDDSHDGTDPGESADRTSGTDDDR